MKIKNIKISLTLSFLNLCALQFNALAAPVAILTDVKGTVQIVKGGKAAAGSNGKQLQEGDVVRVAKGSATVYYVTKPPQPLRAGQQVHVTTSRTGSAPALWNNVYAGITSGFERRKIKTAATVRNPGIQTLSPVNSRILERPLFVWDKPETASNELTYSLTLSDTDGATVWQTTTQQPFLEYPTTAPTLEPGKRYVWMVETTNSNTQRKLQSRNAWFEIAAPSEVEVAHNETTQLSTESKSLPAHTRKVILASSLIQKRFYADAIRTLVPEIYATSALSQGAGAQKLGAVLLKLDASSRVLLRDCYLNTRQNDLAQKIDAVAP